MIVEKSPICADAGDEIFMVTGLQDRKKVLPHKRFSTPKIYLKDLMGGKLVDHVEALIVG
jgi:hypothetical protein